jgi:hypothetical protein
MVTDLASVKAGKLRFRHPHPGQERGSSGLLFHIRTAATKSQPSDVQHLIGRGISYYTDFRDGVNYEGKLYCHCELVGC